MLKTGDDFELQRIHNTYNTASAYNHRLSAKTANGESEYTVLEVKLYGGNDLTEASSSQS